jgi:hypothetical protein
MKRANRTLLGIAVVLLALPFAGRAQEGEDGPALGVARVSLTNGDVTVRRGESGDWVQAEVNAPLVDGDSIATGPGSRAEVQLDHSNLLRLGPDSEVHMASLGNRQFRVQIERGVVTYSELRGGEADIDIETPLVAVRPGKNGQYRVEVHGDGEAWIMVRQGEAEVASPAGIEVLKKGKRMIVRAGLENSDSEFIITKATPRDEWDEWNQHRDKRLRKSESYRHVSSSIYGVEDLDDHGRWTYVSGYGNCWFPSAGADWAPYRQGRWRYIDYYGWTWVSYEPWGWAPYHYGRWFNHTSYGWGWYPGAHYSHHYWRPALVSFFGWNSHSGFNFGFGVGGHHYPYGHVGWIPLAPGERYHPWYGRRHGGGHNTVIVNNNINIHNGFRNARARNGVNVVAADRFARGLADQPQSLRASELRRATVMRGQIPVVPESQSRGNVVRRSTLRAASSDRGTGRQFFSTNRSRSERPVQRASFEQQRQDVTRSIRSFADSEGRRAGTSGGSTGTVGRVARSRTGSVSSGGTAATSGGVRSATTGGTTRGQRSRGSQATVSSGTGSTGSVRGSTTATTGSRRATTGSSRATTASPRATTSSRGSSGSSGSQWQTFSRSRSGSPPATVRSTPDRSSTRNRTFRTGDPQVLNGSSGGRTVAPRTNSRVSRGASQTNSSVPRTSARRSNSGTFAPRTRSRANTNSRSNSSSAGSRSGSRSTAPRVNSSRSNSRSSGGSTPRSSSRARSSSGGGYTGSRSSRGRSAASSMPNRSSSIGRSPSRRSAPSVSRSPNRSSGGARSSGGGGARSSSGGSGRSGGGARGRSCGR